MADIEPAIQGQRLYKKWAKQCCAIYVGLLQVEYTKVGNDQYKTFQQDRDLSVHRSFPQIKVFTYENGFLIAVTLAVYSILFHK